MIEDGSGNVVTADVDAVVNTVNTVGVMGKGIALQIKRAYPEVYDSYRAAHQRGELRIGRMHVHDRGVLGPRRYVINFPTKRDWRQPSRLTDIEAGLIDLVRVLDELGVASVAVPALGCGNGGLNWHDVRPLIERAFQSLPDVRAVLYPPSGAPPATAMPNATPRAQLTTARALLLTAMARYTRAAAAMEWRDGISELETQKLAYFLQVLGAPLRLDFARGRYGPYADNLRHVLNQLEGHHIVGYGDRTAKVTELVPITVMPESADQAARLLAADDEAEERLAGLLRLVDGFETPYSVELLATVHFAAYEDPRPASVQELTERVRSWNPRKSRLFTTTHVRVAAERLADEGLQASLPSA